MESYGMKPEPRTHNVAKMVLIISHVFVLLATVILNYMSSPALTVDGLFMNDTGSISDEYETKITPASWTFTIWAFIYTWQLIHAIYSLTLLCRKSDEGHYLYVSPGHVHYSFYLVYIINMGLNVGWIFLFDRQQMEASFVFLFLIALTIYICGVIVCRSLNKAAPELQRSGQAKDIWFTRLLILNGMAFYGTWCTIATLLNLCIVLQYRASVDGVVCAWIALAVLTVELLAWFILETFVFDRYLRYCFMPYVVLLVAFGGVISKQYRMAAAEPYMYYVIILMVASGVLGIVKLVVMIVRGIRNPISYNSIPIVSTLANQEEAA